MRAVAAAAWKIRFLVWDGIIAVFVMGVKAKAKAKAKARAKARVHKGPAPKELKSMAVTRRTIKKASITDLVYASTTPGNAGPTPIMSV